MTIPPITAGDLGVFERIEWRQQYDPPRDEYEGDLVMTINNQPSLTQQHFALDADINTIMARFGVKDGAIPPMALDPSFFGDFSDVPDFRDAMDAVLNAKNRFNALPATIRNRFNNDPVALWQFVNNPDNFEEAVTLGLLKKQVAVPPATPETPDGVT